MKWCVLFIGITFILIKEGLLEESIIDNTINSGTENYDEHNWTSFGKDDLKNDTTSVEEGFRTDRHAMIMVMKNISVQEPPGHHEIIAGVPLPGPLHEHLPEIHKYWEPFKEVHQKLYRVGRDLKRKQQWVENLIRIHQHNEKARDMSHGYFLRANHLADLNIREYIKQMLRATRSYRDPMPPPNPQKTRNRQIYIPEEWNWIEQGFYTPSWDQENCGSCYAFSIAGSAQGQYFRKTRQLHNLSVQQIVDCSIFTGNLGCYGGSLRNALRYCSRAGGLMSAEEYPYKARQRLCHYLPWHRSVNVSSYVILPEYDEEAIQEAVATVGPVACSVDASPYTFQLYHKGIYDDPTCSQHRVNHAMLIVGYTKDAWILKNWWGEHWGIDGYMYMKKGVNQCAIAKYAGYPVVEGDLINIVDDSYQDYL